MLIPNPLEKKFLCISRLFSNSFEINIKLSVFYAHIISLQENTSLFKGLSSLLFYFNSKSLKEWLKIKPFFDTLHIFL
jgi:hypothetical protein